jgi:serine/threonine protein kinase
MDEMASLLHKRVYGDFVIRRVVGAGAMGAVLEAYSEGLRKRIAVKVLLAAHSANQQIAPRFVQEAVNTARVRAPGSDELHENVVDILAHGQLDDGRWFIAMEYLDGMSLGAYLRSHGPLDMERAITITVQICSALDAAHRAGLTHRDLKPDNIMLVQTRTRQLMVKVVDFGLAKLRSDAKGSGGETRPGMVLGTPLYMAPEQVECPSIVGAQADIFALGVILYEMLTGRVPYAWPESADSDAAAMLALTLAKRSLPIPATSFRPDLHPSCDTVIARCLFHDLEYRYPNVRLPAIHVAELDPEGAALFRALWPGYAAEADDFTVRNPDLFRAPKPSSEPAASVGSTSNDGAVRSPSAVPLVSLGGSPSAAVGEVARPSRVSRPTAKLGAIALGAAAIAAGAILVVTRAADSADGARSRRPAAAGYAPAAAAEDRAMVADAGVVVAVPPVRPLAPSGAPTDSKRALRSSEATPDVSQAEAIRGPKEPSAEPSEDVRQPERGRVAEPRRRRSSESGRTRSESDHIPKAPKKPLDPNDVPGL